MEQLDWFRQVPVIETKRCRMRGVQLHDGRALHSFLSDKETMKYITSNPPSSEEEVNRKITQSLQRFHQKKEIPWAVLDKESQSLVGWFRLHKVDLWHRKAELGAVFHKAYQRKGYGREVLEAVLSFAFHDLQLNRVVGDIFADNQASESLLRHFHFQKEGRLRQTDFDGHRYHDTVVYALLKSDFEAGR